MTAELIPTDAYSLMRRIATNKKVKIPSGGPDNDAAVNYLLSRKLAEKADNDTRLVLTDAGLKFGRIMHKG